MTNSVLKWYKRHYEAPLEIYAATPKRHILNRGIDLNTANKNRLENN